MTENLTYDYTAEQAVIGAVMLAPEQTATHFLGIRPEDWYTPVFRDTAAVIRGLMADGKPIEPATVLVEAQNRGLVGRKIQPVALFEAQQAAAVPASVPVLAERIRNLSAARKLSETGIRLAQRMDSAWTSGADRADIDDAIAATRRACDEAEQIAADPTSNPPTPMGDFLAQPSHHNWIVPGLLERMDRIVLTGAEGGGKSVLCTQIATTLAAGLHPFTGNLLGSDGYRARVLVIDCENSPSQSRRRYKWVTRMVNDRRTNHGLQPVDWNESMSIEVRPAGIDLRAGDDAAWLERAIADTNPDLLVLGPLYKLHRMNPNDEQPARDVVWVLDGLRERYGFALLTEAHAGKSTTGDGRRNMSPIGASLWLRWSEFGFGLARAADDPGKGRAEIVDVVSWRGAREERDWPSKLQFSHILPWMPSDPDYYDQARRSQ
ncbi:AAA family ATPase [Nocardia xishanensis]|uniref:AAA family ATPase n=1 Tax=Nocardia xishanensis TaxID=238964 RepID=UPI00082C2438|nr:AAA family ATPase [Nocardia xishanensis]